MISNFGFGVSPKWPQIHRATPTDLCFKCVLGDNVHLPGSIRGKMKKKEVGDVCEEGNRRMGLAQSFGFSACFLMSHPIVQTVLLIQLKPLS